MSLKIILLHAVQIGVLFVILVFLYGLMQLLSTYQKLDEVREDQRQNYFFELFFHTICITGLIILLYIITH